MVSAPLLGLSPIPLRLFPESLRLQVQIENAIGHHAVCLPQIGTELSWVYMCPTKYTGDILPGFHSPFARHLGGRTMTALALSSLTGPE